MKFGTMFSDVSGSLFRRPATENYPFVRQRNPTRLRSFLKWNPETCTGCGLCAMDCPANAIQVTMLDRKEKRFVFYLSCRPVPVLRPVRRKLPAGFPQHGK